MLDSSGFEASTMTTTILVADDSEFVRRAVCMLLKKQSDFHIVGEAHDGHEAVEKVKELRPEVVVMDVSMPGMNGVAAASAISEISPETKVIFLTDYPAPSSVGHDPARTRWSYVAKSDANKSLVEAVRGNHQT